MVRQIGAHFQEPSMIVLEERVHHLENTAAALAGAVRILASALHDGAAGEPGSAVAEAARQANDLLLAVAPRRR